ncbi:DUF5994 family protein [Nocardioides nitrophenolicus]|uniref:DUF5994 family protein n=1 Tax=Nocardioides nitrophenolicus TaxID=60489 RepID=UPI00195A91F5|nr:DUF5994 family protein [Nocardioides nitrophenolicus]MBM7519194.1 hypothetical protein [Nocardioides nitrophenolicus]
MTTSSSALSRHQPENRVPLRIALYNGFQSQVLDGAWWPQSRDLQAECADLIDNFPRMLGRPARLLFSRPDWDVVVGRPSARKILASRGTVKVGSFPGDDTHLMVVVMESGERIHLLVIPSTCESDTADLLMGQATDERNTLSAASLLASAKRITGDVALQTSAWESEGGAAGREP